MAFVPDATVAAARVLPDDEMDVADLALDRLRIETAKVPDFSWHELRNLLLSAERRMRIDAHRAEASKTRLLRLHRAWFPTDPLCFGHRRDGRGIAGFPRDGSSEVPGQ